MPPFLLGHALACIIYFALFTLLTWPLMLSFNTHFFTDMGDGLQNIWNMWWVDYAVTRLHTHPWFTPMLHYPYGVTLIPQTLNPFNGFVGIILQSCMSLTQAFNTMVVFSFVAGGWATFLLARELGRGFGSAVLAGALFTFSNYHFGHAQGHMQLVSLEWLPLFAWCWLRLLRRPAPGRAVAAAAALALVILCDYYYFIYSVVIGAALWAMRLVGRGGRRKLLRPTGLGPFVLFAAFAFALTGPLVLALVRLIASDPLIGSHDSLAYSMDLAAPFVPGAFWRFSALTEPLWRRMSGNVVEQSVYLGWGLITLALIGAALSRPRERTRHWPWWVIFAGFFVMAFGPDPVILGHRISNFPMPYGLAQRLLPILDVGGMPVRFFVVSMLAGSLLAALGADCLIARRPIAKAVLGLLLALILFENLPGPNPDIQRAAGRPLPPIPLTRIEPPGYVQFLRDAPEPGAVIDLLTTPDYAMAHALVYQTIHERPMAFGYVSRHSATAARRMATIQRAADEGRWSELPGRYGLKYLVTKYPADLDEVAGFTKVFHDETDGTFVYRMPGSADPRSP